MIQPWVRFILHHPYAIVAAILFSIIAIPILQTYNYTDFDYTYAPAGHSLWTGQDIYGHHDGYIYPPFPALIAVPFSFLPNPAARFAWYSLSFVCLIGMCRLSWRLAGGGRLEIDPSPTSRREHLIFLLGIFPAFLYAMNCLSHSQTDAMIDFLILAGCTLWIRSRTFLAATLFAFAAAMKGPALLFCPYLLWQRRPLQATWMLVVFIAVNLAPNLMAPHLHHWLFQEWIATYLLPMGHSTVYPGVWFLHDNQTFTGCIHRWLTTTWHWIPNDYSERIPRSDVPRLAVVNAIVFTAMGLMLVITLLSGAAHAVSDLPSRLLRARPRPLLQDSETASTKGVSLRPALQFSCVMILMLLFSPMAAKAQWGVLMLPGFTLARLAIQHKNRTIESFLFSAIIVGLLSQNFLGHRGTFITLWYGAVMWSAILYWAGCCVALLNNGEWRMDN